MARTRKSFTDLAGGGVEKGPHHPLLASLSPAIIDRLRIYESLLRKWQPSINLVGSRTLDELWIRHFADSLQVPAAIPEARHWLDLGSGAGFPGLVTAILHADDPTTRVHLVESDRRKCAFLREVSRETGAPALIHCDRIEHFVPALTDPIDAVSARALAPLGTLLVYAEPILDKGAVAIFSKGKQADTELTKAEEAGKYLIMTVPSQTDAESRLVIVRRK